MIHVSKNHHCLNFQVLEIRPLIDWDKGKAVEFLLESLGMSTIVFTFCAK